MNCPVPAFTLSGNSVVPKDEFGNFVIPKNREGTELIKIAPDGVTAVSTSEWTQWKKYNREYARTAYHNHQQTLRAAAGANNNMAYPMNSVFEFLVISVG